mmetsp:Transcript_43939/g.107355  ORF Transcript_43939/g.107355 Transcript_43939/m.107355 type:complete len:210 (-) Transcript_43939:1077-1706(-)
MLSSLSTASSAACPSCFQCVSMSESSCCSAPMSQSSTADTLSEAHLPMARIAALRGSMASLPFSSLACSCRTRSGMAMASRTFSLPTWSMAKLPRARAAESCVSTSLYLRHRTNSVMASISSRIGRPSTSKAALASAWHAIPDTTSSSCLIIANMFCRKPSVAFIACRTLPCSAHALQFSRIARPSLRSGISTGSPASSPVSTLVLYFL